MPAPVLSRSCFTISAEIAIVAIVVSFGPFFVCVDLVVTFVYKQSAGSQAGA
jgi:hypothetical protein